MRKILLFFIVALVLLPAASRAEESYENRLDRGIRNSDPYGYVLLKEAQENRAEATEILNKAAQYAPDLPAVYFALAKAHFSFSRAGILQSVDYTIEGIDAYLRNFLWSFSFAASVCFSLLCSFVLAFFFIIAIRLFSDMKLISHDVAEGNLTSLLLLGLVIVSLSGPLFFIAGVLIFLGIYMKKTDRAAVYLYLLFLVFSPLVFHQASLFVNALSSGNFRAVAHVNSSQGNRYALSVLEGSEDSEGLFSYALALKREGRYEEAIAAYKKLLGERPDPRAYVNLGNCYVGLYDFAEGRKHYLDKAADYYEAAIAIRPLASAYYNLSQVSREMIDFAAGNDFFRSALALNRDSVAEYSAFYARTPNRFVVDETLSSGDLWKYAGKIPGNTSTFGTAIIPLPYMTFAGLLLVIVFYALSRRTRGKAYRCRKCETVLCPACEKRLTWGQLCPQCYGSLVKLDELDVKERVARLLSIYEKQRRRTRTLKILAFSVPGFAQLYAGRVLFGLIFLWPFLFCVVMPFAPGVFITESALFSHNLLRIVSWSFAGMIYVVSNFITRGRLSRGWL
jgi:tetratricopeptide (TPR) repeat protein